MKALLRGKWDGQYFTYRTPEDTPFTIKPLPADVTKERVVQGDLVVGQVYYSATADGRYLVRDNLTLIGQSGSPFDVANAPEDLELDSGV